MSGQPSTQNPPSSEDDDRFNHTGAQTRTDATEKALTPAVPGTEASHTTQTSMKDCKRQWRGDAESDEDEYESADDEKKEEEMETEAKRMKISPPSFSYQLVPEHLPYQRFYHCETREESAKKHRDFYREFLKGEVTQEERPMYPLEKADFRRIKNFCTMLNARVIGKVAPLDLVNITPGLAMSPVIINEWGDRLDFPSTFYAFCIANNEVDGDHALRDIILVTLELHIATVHVMYMKSLPFGMPIPEYLTAPANAAGKYTTTPGVSDKETFEERFEKYLNKGMNNILAQYEAGIPAPVT